MQETVSLHRSTLRQQRLAEWGKFNNFDPISHTTRTAGCAGPQSAETSTAWLPASLGRKGKLGHKETEHVRGHQLMCLTANRAISARYLCGKRGHCFDATCTAHPRAHHEAPRAHGAMGGVPYSNVAQNVLTRVEQLVTCNTTSEACPVGARVCAECCAGPADALRRSTGSHGPRRS